MSDHNFKILPTRIAKAIAMSLMLAFTGGAAKASEGENTSGEVPTAEDERKKREAQVEAKSRKQTEKVKAGLPKIGGTGEEAKGEAELKKSLVKTVAGNVAQTMLNAFKGKQAGGPGVTEQVTEQAVNQGLSAGINAAKESDNALLNNLTGSVSWDGDIDYNLQTIGVIAGVGAGHTVLGQVGVHNEQDSSTANVGLVYRYITPDKNALFGANVFYDHDFDAGAHRMGVGVEAATQSTRWFANAYAPLSGQLVHLQVVSRRQRGRHDDQGPDQRRNNDQVHAGRGRPGQVDRVRSDACQCHG
jgi:hypothetical protein